MTHNKVLCAMVVAWALACGSSGNQTPDTGGTEVIEEVGTDIQDETGAGEALEAVEVVPDEVVDLVEVDSAKPETTGACEKDEDCPAEGLGQCQVPSCDKGVCGWKWDKSCCLDNREKPFLLASFEDGLPEGWTVSNGESNGAVGWQVVAGRHVSGQKSIYFGDPKCKSYYSGALGEDCLPVDPEGKDAGRVYGSVTTPPVKLPPLENGIQVVTFALYSAVEPYFTGLPDEMQSDILKVFIIVDPSGPSPATEVLFTTLDLAEKKQTGGKFVLVSADLTGFAGKEIAIKLSFDTSDGTNNLYEGIYIDDLAVFSVCDLPRCKVGTKCKSDALDCTDDNCTPFLNNPGEDGVCWYFEDPTCVEPECNSENYKTKCPITKENPECWEVSCPEGKCVYTLLPDCCQNGVKFQANFDDGGMGGFTAWASSGNGNVKWQVSSKRSSSGKYSLYYGDVVSGTYFSGDAANYGEVTSPEVSLSGGDFYFLTFKLFMSTEFDKTVPENYYNPVGADLFEVQVIQNLGKPNESQKRVWSSDNIYGTTLDKSGSGFIPVGINLTDFKAKNIRIRFVFSTADAQSNTFEGVYVDDVSLSYDCVLHECKGVWDCGFDELCKPGVCENDLCKKKAAQIEGCCASAQDCDDGDPCTLDGCLKNQCYHYFVESPTCCKEETFAEFLFEGEAEFQQWAVVDSGTPGRDGPEVTWRYSDQRFVGDYPGAAYFGDAEGKTYDNLGTAYSTLTSPEIQVPNYGEVQLSFWVFMDLDPQPTFNTFWLDVVPMDGITPERKVFEKSPEMVYGAWVEVKGISLKDFKGMTIKLRFTFDGIHHEGTPTGTGVWIDSIRAEKVCHAI